MSHSIGSFHIGKSIVLGVIAGVLLYGISAYFTRLTGTSIYDDPSSNGYSLAMLGWLFNIAFAFVPAWIAGYLHPQRGVIAGFAAAAIGQVLIQIWNAHLYGLHFSFANSGLVPGLIDATLVGAATGGAAQLIRLSGGIAAYFEGTILQPHTMDNAPPNIIPPTNLDRVHVAFSIVYFILGVIASLVCAVALCMLIGDRYRSLDTMILHGVGWFVLLTAIVISSYFFLRRSAFYIYAAIGMFVVLPAIIVANATGF
jgi:hypothetical protein